MKRRDFVKYAALGSLAIAMPFPVFGTGEPNDIMRKKAMQIHKKALTLDSHTDTPLQFRNKGWNFGALNNPRKGGGKIDIPRMQAGGLDAAFFAVFIGQGKRDDEGFAKAKQRALELFEAIKTKTAENAENAQLAFKSSDLANIAKTGKRAIYMGIENGYPVGNDIKNVQEFYNLGARYITLCHSKNNHICDSSTDAVVEHNGLSEYGKKVVAEMNRLGIMIDVSHISDKSFLDVIETSKTPVIASHSCAKALCDHPRNLSNDLLRKLKANGGVIQMCILSDYVVPAEKNPERDLVFRELYARYRNFDSMNEAEKEKLDVDWEAAEERFPQKLATVADAVDHIDHIVKTIGIDYVGIGTDFDGGGGLADCFDASELPNITLELVKRGYTEKDIYKIWSGNFMRVFKEVERFARV